MGDVLIIDKWANLISRVLKHSFPNHIFHDVGNDDEQWGLVFRNLVQQRADLRLVVVSYERGEVNGKLNKMGPQLARKIRAQFPSVLIYGFNLGWTHNSANESGLSGFTADRGIMLNYVKQYLEKK